MELIVIVFIATVTCFFGVSFGLFLLYLTLKIKSEFRETLRYEIDKNRKIYDFIRQRGVVTVEEIVERFDGITTKDIRFPVSLAKWQGFLKNRIGELKTLEGEGNTVYLTKEVKRFFVYDDPSLGDLLRYIYFTYIKHEEFPKD